jgi:hypothetical protein
MREEWYYQVLSCGNNQYRTLLDVCLDVHMTNAGSFDRPAGFQCNDILALEHALATWKEDLPRSKQWDDAVKTLIELVLREKPCSIYLGNELAKKGQLQTDFLAQLPNNGWVNRVPPEPRG